MVLAFGLAGYIFCGFWIRRRAKPMIFIYGMGLRPHAINIKDSSCKIEIPAYGMR
jgi:hypothetical protein